MTDTWDWDAKPRTGAEQYFADQMEKPEFARSYREARARIDGIDRILRAVDECRNAQGLTKAALARRANLKPDQVRRLLTAEGANPTLQTTLALTAALGLELVPTPVEQGRLEHAAS
jgi:DNA-binding phage protein